MHHHLRSLSIEGDWAYTAAAVVSDSFSVLLSCKPPTGDPLDSVVAFNRIVAPQLDFSVPCGLFDLSFQYEMVELSAPHLAVAAGDVDDALAARPGEEHLEPAGGPWRLRGRSS